MDADVGSGSTLQARTSSTSPPSTTVAPAHSRPSSHVYQSGETDHRGSLSRCGPTHLRWALIEAALRAARHPVYAERYQRTAARLGRQRGTKVARVDITRRMAEEIWHMLTTAQPFPPAGAAKVLAA